MVASSKTSSLSVALSQKFVATTTFHFQPTRFLISELHTENGSFADEGFYYYTHLLFIPTA